MIKIKQAKDAYGKQCWDIAINAFGTNTMFRVSSKSEVWNRIMGEVSL